MSAASPPNPGREASDASLRVIGIIAASLAAGVAAAILTSFAIFSAGRSTRSLAPGLGASALFQNGLVARTGIEKDWVRIDAETKRHLHSYGWIDRREGIVRIPIDRAMEILSERRP